MDFTFTTEQDEAAELAATILKDHCTNERQKAVEAEGHRFDRTLWKALADAGLLGIALPDEHGGGGMGLLELTRVLVECGRVVAPVPIVVHTVAGLTVAEHGADAVRQALLPGAADGSTLLTVAAGEEREALPEHPGTSATPGEAGWRLDGTKTVVSAGADADAYLVTARTDEASAVFLVRSDDTGVTVTPQNATDNERVAQLVLTDVALDDDRLVGATDGSTVRWLHDRLTVATCAVHLGVVEGALSLTSGYARTREQFGRPIGSFQAVAQRLADGFIDVLGARLTLWQAAWRLAEGLPAATEVAVAKLWAADAGHRLAHTTVHVHGGVGIDLDGEAHRFFTTAKRLEFTLGAGTEQALTVGRALATEPVA
ncbi:acyl-CoA dehydrogenase family protein [Nocardioides massiliensis]|uniref:Alkylation response protein AidB-like acyl-CoA dehydrogenase n=1 Tax=Nocardioides massiliensis TaxID=1325935 RepID=A0ABT9NRX2_9ACTN|nr:acyl-CoA dehydrogenase family protein [Nocardioides massiliensis]MDP9823143.1 alkylation response protein AidB-like acyl-CoA dehydrogenase [Nocardioides massiliensis]